MRVYTWVEWKEKFAKQAGQDKQLHHDLDCTGLVPVDDINFEKKKLEYALGYAANTLMEHNVSGAFIKNYMEKYGDTDEWINIAYVKELFEILAQPIVTQKQTEESK